MAITRRTVLAASLAAPTAALAQAGFPSRPITWMNPSAPGGVLDASIRPATRTSFINLNDATQLAKFGLRNGPTDDANNLSEKWEALTLVPALDPTAPDDYFLLVGNDNDFQTRSGFHDGAAYDAGVENDTMILVYRITLPGRVVNFSSRALTGSGTSAHVLGFVVNGPKPKTMLIRGIGPTLASFGVAGALPDPTLTVFNSANQAIASNNDWSTPTTGGASAADVASATTRAGAFTLGNGSKDAALLAQLDPGTYTLQVTDVNGATGLSLAEVFEIP